MKKNRIFWITASTGTILDRITKYWVANNFSDIGDTVPLWQDVFHLTYVVNTGAAFSFFSGGVGWLRWLSLIVSVGLVIYALSSRLSKIEQLGYGFILAGAFGNGIDRFLFGHVVDFLDFRLINFPVFNVADIAINLGILFLLIYSFSNPTNNKA
ncbi:signal peptidase II [Myxosarcina sp. GI1]|uniref:signal peptidase II n=1 Tax=Myxosarcina sp. GI1 TaxID=1541065 RepID=UPI00055ACDDD|nr:signal peptidase II [Myxosarcina sp. GI1]